jgi:hypothetical protein
VVDNLDDLFYSIGASTTDKGKWRLFYVVQVEFFVVEINLIAR